MKNPRFLRTCRKGFPFTLSRFLVFCAGLICASRALGQGEPGGDTPTGLAGGFGGSITTGAGSFDPYERNASRSITDIVVPGAVVPFTYTRIWNSRSGWSNNWSWRFDEIIVSDSNNSGDNLFRGYNVHYPDGRLVKFDKPSYATPVGGPGTYVPGVGIQDRFVIPPNGASAQLFLTDGSVVNFDIYGDLTSIADPHGIAITVTYGPQGMTIQEPGGRIIVIHPPQYSNNYRTITSTVTASRDQSSFPSQTVTYTDWYYTNGTYDYDGHGDPDSDSIKTDRGAVIYNDIIDPNTGVPIEAHYVYKWVQPPSPIPNAPLPPDNARLIWASDPMFDGPVQQVKYTYVDNMSAPTGDVHMSAVVEVRWAPNYWDPNAAQYHDPGVLVSRVEMLPWTYSQLGGNSEGYYTRQETRGDGAVRTISYWNPTAVYMRYNGTGYQQVVGGGQTLVDHFTDYKNDLTQAERHEYGWGQTQFQTPIKITDALQNVTLQTLEPVMGHLTRQTHQMDNSYRSWTYTDPASPFYVETDTDENTKQTIYTRDPTTHRVLHILYPDQSTEDFSYNGFGQVLTHKLTTGGTETCTYDTRGLKQTFYPPATESDPAPWSHPTGYFYYTTGPSIDRLQRVQDPRGNSTSYEYNGRGQVTKVTHQDSSYTQSSYNGDGTLAWTADENHPGAATDPTQRTRYTYDEYRRVVSVTNPMGETTITDYALDWYHPLAHTTNNPHYILSPGGKNIFFDYDANLRKKDQAVGLSSPDESWTLFEYDEVGNLTKITDPRFKETKFHYDGRNRKIWMDDPIASDRNSSGHTMNWEYDFVGNKTKETRADDSFRSWDYDSMNRLWHAYDWRTNDPPQPYQTTTYDQTADGRTRHITDTKGAIYTLGYDELLRKTSETYPVDALGQSRTETFSYDAAGNLILYTNPAGQRRHLAYDVLNRMFDAWWDGWVAPEIVIGYDAASRMTSMVTNTNLIAPETTLTFSYDDANRKVWEEQTVAGYPTRRVTAHPNADGQRADLGVSMGGWTFYGPLFYDYTQRGQVARIKADPNTVWITYGYDAAGNMVNRSDVLNGVNDSTNVVDTNGNSAYDELNRPTVWEQTGAGDVPFARSHYQYDKVGREVATWRDEQAGQGERFWYNAANQVTAALYNANNVWTDAPTGGSSRTLYNYTPDLLNRVSINDNGYVSPWVIDGMNQYTSVNGSAVGYDGNFNLTYLSGATYNFDAANHLITGSNGGNTAGFVYDGLGRCLKRTINNRTAIITYDDWNPVVEWNENGSMAAANVYGERSDEILYRYDAATGGQYRYHSDIHGNVNALLDVSGNIIERYTYDAFGQPSVTDVWGNSRGTTSADGNRFMFKGREWIPELRIYDYRHRHYNPSLGRFLQTDPMGLQTEGAKLSAEQKALFSPGGVAPDAFTSSEMNLYRYCGDDPVDKSDPTGLLTVIVPGYGPGQSEDANTKWSNQQFIQYAKATDPHNYAVFKRSDKAGMLKAIMNARAHGDKTVKIFGYSRGAVAAVELAQRLQTLNISVDRLLSVDPIRLPTDTSRNFSVPNNVTKAENYYQGLAHSGFLVFPSMRLNGAVENHPLSGTLPDGTEIIHQNMPSVVSKVGGY
ncbi:MAG: RHS repeat-associated core domain-containing protein [Chthoniobacterales bacterium]